MRFASLLLANLYYPESGYGLRLNYPPVSLGYLSENLHAHGIPHAVVDTGAGVTSSALIRRVGRLKPDLIGFSLNSICFPRSLELIRRIRERYPTVAIVVGGPHVSTYRAQMLVDNPEIDFAVAGEGEIPLASLCRGEPLADIPGLIFRSDDGAVRANPTVLQPIDTLPFPRYSLFGLGRNYRSGSVGILTSRGCPFECGFCQQSSLLGKKWRGRSPEGVVEEILFWHEQGFALHVLDDNFTLDKGRVARIADLLADQRTRELDLSLVGGVRVRGTDRALLETLQRLGVKYLSFGIESGSNRILEMISKGLTVEEADSVVSLAVSMGFFVRLFFILGFPTETMEDMRKTFAFALRHRVREVRFFNLIPYDHTGIMGWLKAHDAAFRYSYSEYMSDFKRFQKIPVFDAPDTLSVEERAEALRTARYVAREVRRRWEGASRDE